MAVIGADFSRRASACLLGAGLLLCCPARLPAWQSGELRSQLNTIATALSAGDPAEAMGPFSKTYSNYDKLSNYFTGLTNAFSIVNEIDVSDESDSASALVATIHWAITLSSLGSNDSNQRSADIHVQLVQEKGKWRFVEFSPIDLFDPSQAQTPTPPPR